MANTRATKLFYELVWPHRELVLCAARIQTGNDAEADDLAQDTLLKAFKAIENFKPGTNAKAWLLTILRNARVDKLRTAAGSARPISLDDLATDPTADVPAHETDSASWAKPEELLAEFSDAEVIDALAGLSEELRWTLLLVDVEQMDHEQSAEILGVPVGTVKSRVHRGRAALRHALLPLARDRRLVAE